MSEATRRLFFALWPDEHIRQGIVVRRERLGRVGRRRVPEHNLHLTLVFLGNQPADRLPEFVAAAEEIRAAGCTLELGQYGWFARARVVWLGGEAPAPLIELQAGLRRKMLGLGLRLDERPFRPHVTLFRQVSRRPPLAEPEPLAWPIRDFVLVESLQGAPYRVVQRWQLRA